MNWPTTALSAEEAAFRVFVEQLILSFQPLQVIWFGSRVWGAPTEWSDFDLLVVFPEVVSPIGKAIEIVQTLQLELPVDLVIRTSADVQRLVAAGDPFLGRICSHGLVLHG